MLLGQLGPRTGRCVFRWALLLLLPAVTGTSSRTGEVQLQSGRSSAGASQCRRGATFSQAVVAPDGGSMVGLPGAVSLPQCVSACCDLPGSDLAWLFQGRCYALSCRQAARCRPRGRPGADSVLVFLRRASPQSLVKGEAYGGRRRPSPPDPEGPGNLESLRDLVLLQGAGQGPPESRTQEDMEGSPERTLQGPETTNQPTAGGGFNQSEEGEGEGPGQGQTGADEDQSQATGSSQGAEGGTRSPAEPRPHTQAPTTPDSSHREVTSLPASARPGSMPAPMGDVITPPPSDQPLILASGNPVDHSVSSELRTGLLEVLQPSHGAPPASTRPPGGLTSDPSTLRSSSSPPTSPSKPEVTGSTRGPLAIVGPDRRLPPCRLLSLADCCLLRGLSGLDGAERPVATATGLQAGEHRLRDQQGATDGTLLSLQVWLKHQPAQPPSAVTVETAPPPPADPGPPPVAHASGSHTLTLPNNSLVLRGSVTGGDQTEVRYLWLRDRQSPAAGDVLYASDSQPSLYLSNLVQGTYLFQLQVTDARGRCSSAAATVEVRPEPGGGQEVELEMLVPVWQVSVAQRDTLVRQLAALLHVLDAELQLRALQGRSPSSTVLRFSVAGPDGPTSASRLVLLLRNQLLGQKNDFLLFRVLRVEAVSCALRCSGRGQCDPVSRQCSCEPFWTENLLRRYLGDGESNCEWRLLYVILSSFMVVLLILTISWTFICCCRRRHTKGRRRTRYTILDNMDDQERVELRPRFCVKHRSSEHNSSLMLSESELDSDQDQLPGPDGPARSRNRVRAASAANTFD